MCLYSSNGGCKLVLVSIGINPGRHLQNFTQNWNCILSTFTKAESKHWTPPKDVTQCVVRLATGLQPLPKRVLHRVGSSASSLSFQYLLLRPPNSCLRLPHCLLVPYIFPSKCIVERSTYAVWPIHLAFLRFVVLRKFLSSLTTCSTSSFFIRSVQLIFTLLQHRASIFSRYFWSTFRSHLKRVPKITHVANVFPFIIHSKL